MNFNCYIDEAGDEGIGVGGSRWFIIGAFIVPSELDNDELGMVTEIKKRLNVKVLHWSKLKKHEQKKFVCQELLSKPWEYCCIATDKNHFSITGAPNMKRKGKLYFYTVRLLFERLSWYARDHGNGKAVPIFEYRSSTSYSDMQDYIDKLSCWEPAGAVRISWKNIEHQKFQLLRKDKCALLQASDCVTGTFRDGLEYNRFDMTEPSYFISLKDRLYRRNGELFSYGIKFLHIKPMDIEQILSEYGWLKNL